MLLNLSNHPSERWSAAQFATATNAYGTVEDMPFPNIPPEMSSAELDTLVTTYMEQVANKQPTAVHVMGEMTFTHRLVSRLMAKGVNCVASTTHRQVTEEDGKKIVQFTFVQFRLY